MERLIKKFKDFFMRYDVEEKNVDLLISAVDTIIEIMSIINIEDYDIVKKMVSFVKLISNDTGEFIDEDMVNDIYIRHIMPVLDELESKYVDKNIKSVTEVVREFIDENHPNVAKVVTRINVPTSDDSKINITTYLDNVDVKDSETLTRVLSTVHEILSGHCRNIVDNDSETCIVPLTNLQLSLNLLNCRLESSVYKQVVSNLAVICGILLSVNNDKTRLTSFDLILDRLFYDTDKILKGIT